MKIVFLSILLLAVVYIAEIEGTPEEKVEDLVDSKDQEEARKSCIKPGESCAGDCQCCNKWTYCKCPLWGAFGCSCVYGDAMVCVRKRKDCAGSGPAIVDNPPGSCFK